jgi:hypothetical protein
MEQRLLDCFRDLADTEAKQLLQFAEFLLQNSEKPTVSTIVQRIPATPDESVVQAIKRLKASYPMLDAARLLGETADLMAQHVLAGRDRAEVIEKLEIMFQRHYQRYSGSDTGATKG